MKQWTVTSAGKMQKGWCEMEFKINVSSRTFGRIGYGLLLLLGVLTAIGLVVVSAMVKVSGIPLFPLLVLGGIAGYFMWMLVWDGGRALQDAVRRRRER